MSLRILMLLCALVAFAHGQPPLWTATTAGPALIPAAVLGDLDGDGVPEVASGSFALAEILSGRTGAPIHFVVPSSNPAALLLASVSDAGDQNADGFPDLLVVDIGGGRVVRVLSGTNLAVLHEVVFPLPLGVWSFSGATLVVGCGDVNGDGRDDYAVGDPGYQGAGSVEFRSGGDGGLLRRVVGFPGSRLGHTLVAAGDVTGDGIPDLFVGALDGAYRVSGAGGPPVPFFITGNVAVDALDASRDVNGDGVRDVAVGCPASLAGGPGSGEAFVVSGFDGTVLFGVTGQPSEGLGVMVSLGDTNGDGIVDLASGCLSQSGPASVTVRSLDTGAQIFQTAAIALDTAGGRFVPDWDGDGADDLLLTGVSSQFQSADVVMVRGGPALFGPGAAGAIPGTPLLTINGDDGGQVRRVDLTVGQSIMIELAQPATNSQPANHVIFAWPTVPLHNAGVVLPGIGPFLKTPPVIDPSNRGGFTLATSVSGLPGLVIFNSFPGQYCVNLPFGIPPGDLTLQGVVETSPLGLSSTNGVTLRVR